jgi:DNA adenine methylase
LRQDMVQPQRSKLIHFTPLRYPGGKGKLAPFVKRLLEANDLLDGDYVEPYAGGAAIGLELLMGAYVSRIHINDLSRPITAFWHSVLHDADELMRLVRDTKVSVRSWDRQKKVFAHPNDHDDLRLGFATFFLNRTNRSGILNGGIIGGRDQTGPWKIDARYNARELCSRIEAISLMRERIHLSRQDALTFLHAKLKSLPKKTLVYLDPPYYEKGKDLYYDFYEHADHESIARFVQKRMRTVSWIVSYDNVAAIRKLYAGCRSIRYGLGYSAREHGDGSEIMFSSTGLRVPKKAGAMRSLRPASARN